jgi:hypothetical protein
LIDVSPDFGSIEPCLKATLIVFTAIGAPFFAGAPL